MRDMKTIVRAANELRRRGAPGLLATVVRVRGSSYRKPGARMLLSREGVLAGSVSGGCVEDDVLRRGWWRTDGSGAALVTYDTSVADDDGWGIGLGCDGVVDLLLERLDVASGLDPIAFFESCIQGQERGALATVFLSSAGDVPIGARLCVSPSGMTAAGVGEPLRSRLLANARAALDDGESRSCEYLVGGGVVHALVEAVRPPPRLFVFGAGPDAAPVASLAATLGWHVVVCEARPRVSTWERFPMADEIVALTSCDVRALIDASDRAAAVVMSHDFERDRDALALLLGSRAAYIGVLGPRARTEKMLAELGRSIGDDARVRSPVGTALGSETPQEIALAIAAEVQACWVDV
jgi:xanthine/CO dehydrogenase XdhC/CoxF family maturation factor